MSQSSGPTAGIILGEAAKPPFAVLPDPGSLFLGRSKRLAALARRHELAPYPELLATSTRGQHDIQAGLPAPVLPSFERIGQALEYGMPPISRPVGLRTTANSR